MKSIDIKGKNYKIILIYLYKFILDILYINEISVTYAFYKFKGEFHIGWYLYSWILVIIFALWLVKLTNQYGCKFSLLLTFSLFLLSFVPFTSMLFGGYDNKYILCNSVYWYMWFLFLSIFLKLTINRSITIPIMKYTHKLTIVAGQIVFVSTILIISAVFTHFRFSFNMDFAYDFRADAASNSLPTISAYLFQWARVCIPIFLSMHIVRKNYIRAAFLFIIQLLNFGYDGMRLTVLITFVAIAVPFIFNEKKTKTKIIFPLITLALIALMILSLIEHLFLKSGEIDRVITFRTFFLPNLIGSWFFDFFTKNIPEYFAASIFKFFGFVSPYAEYGIDYLISGLYFGDYSCRGNNGLIADAMCNLGYIGILIMPFVINIWLFIVDRVSGQLNITIKLLVAIYFAYCFTNNFFTIILITNGGIIATFIMNAMNHVDETKTIKSDARK